MANGKRFDRHKLTAACWWFPLGTVIRVVNLENGKSVVVTITDRGPNHRLNRVLDLSEAAAAQLDYVGRGLTRVFLSPVVAVETQPAELDVHWTQPLLNEPSGVYERGRNSGKTDFESSPPASRNEGVTTSLKRAARSSLADTSN